MHGDWYKIPVGNSSSVNAKSTGPYDTGVTKRTILTKQKVRSTTPSKPKRNNNTTPCLPHKTKKIVRKSKSTSITTTPLVKDVAPLHTESTTSKVGAESSDLNKPITVHNYHLDSAIKEKR